MAAILKRDRGVAMGRERQSFSPVQRRLGQVCQIVGSCEGESGVRTTTVMKTETKKGVAQGPCK
jgi:hypothetical protein